MTTPLEPETRQYEGKDFVLSKFPATVGREIITQYPMTGLPKIGDYKSNHLLMLKVLSYVAVQTERPEPLMLSNETLVNQHISSTETLMRLEWDMIGYNFDFFVNGKASGFLDLLAGKLQESITKTLMGLKRQ